MNISKLHNIRQEYIKEELLESRLHPNPLKQFSSWMNDAFESKVLEPTAMTIATVNSSGQPSTRTVLLKDITPKGFVFYTNYNSQKGKDLTTNSRISLLFFWPELERQVRIEGKAEKTSFQDSETYFHSRPFGSQISALISPQSEIIESREILKSKIEAYKAKYRNQPIPMPNYWGGYLVVPHRIEFWQGGANRLHDRLVYVLNGESWQIQRLAP